MPIRARVANVMTSPRTSNGWSPGAQNGPRSGATGVVAISPSLPQRELVVEQGQHGRGEQVLEGQQAHERPDDGRVHGPGHALSAAPGPNAAADADGGDDRAEGDALDLAP